MSDGCRYDYLARDKAMNFILLDVAVLLCMIEFDAHFASYPIGTLWVHSISLLCSVNLHLRQSHPSIMVHSFLLLGSTLVTGLIGTQIEDAFYFILFYFYQ